jgi:hypothetical protein
MTTTYKEKLLKEIEETPQDIIPELYGRLHRFRLELMEKSRLVTKRGSHKEIWKDSVVDEKLSAQARISLFPYEES